MGTQENKASASRFLEEVMNRGNVSLIDELSGADLSIGASHACHSPIQAP